jgi:MFS family permease
MNINKYFDFSDDKATSSNQDDTTVISKMVVEDESQDLLKEKQNGTRVQNADELLSNHINKIGLTQSHLSMAFTCAALFFADGSVLYSLNLLQPALKTFFNLEGFMYSFLASSIFIGYVLGTFLTGFTAKTIGREKTVNIVLSFLVAFCIGICIVQNIYWILFCRFMIGFSKGVISSHFISNLSESLPDDNKEIIILSMFIFYRLGIIYIIFCSNVIMPNYEIERYQLTLLAAAMPMVIVFLLTKYFYKNSAKLLMTKGEYEEAVKRLKEQSCGSGEYNEEAVNAIVEKFKEEAGQGSGDKFTMSELFSHKYRMLTLLTTTVCVAASMVNITNIYSLPLILFSKAVDKHKMNFEIMITQFVTIPAILLSAFVCKVIGKKVTIMFGFFFCLLSSLVPSIIQEGIIIGSSFINFFIIFALIVVKVYIVDAYPTNLRDYALALCLCFAKVGDTLTPFLCNVGFQIYAYGPLLLTNLLCLCGLLGSYYLPNEVTSLHLD